MFKSLFAKFITAFILILITGFSITGISLNYFLTDYLLEEKTQSMTESANIVRGFLTENIDNLSSPIVMSYFRYLLKSYNANEQYYIWVVDKNGKILITENIFVAAGIPEPILNKLRREGGDFYLPDERQYKKILQSDIDFLVEEGYFYGLFELTNMPWMTIQIPFEYEDTVYAVIYINTPIPEVQRARTTIIKFFFFSVSISIVISILLVYIFSKRMTNPLKEISKAARQISSGEFNKRININSKDEIGELASSFNQMSYDLQRLDEMRSSFIANVSHELRTPMTSIKGFVEGILDGTIPQNNQGQYLAIVRDEISRLNRLVSNLLQLASLEAGEFKLKKVMFNINELLRLCIIKLEPMIIEKDLNIEAQFEEDVMMVYADTDAIERVVLNLIHNAIKFTPQKGVIAIHTEYKKAKVEVSIRDTGIGIDDEDIKKIWDRFYKTDKSRSKEKHGTGLGLAITKTLILEHNENIWVESKSGEGTKFTFMLRTSED